VTRKAKVKRGDCRGIGLSGQMHGSVFLGDDPPEEATPLRRALLWNDQRTAAECAEIEQAVGGRKKLISKVGNPALTGFTAPKVLWVRKHEPEVFERTRHVLLPKDYIRYRLTGDLITEVSDASGTGLLDVRRRTWSTRLLELAGIPADILPALVESEAVTGEVSISAAAEMGLRSGVPVVGGGGDSVLQTTAMGIVDAGILGITLGTAGIVAGATDRCPDNPGGLLQVSCGNAPNRWHVMGVALNAGGAWEWWRRALAPLRDGVVPPHEVLIQLAEESPPGARGARFLPYLLGERFPEVDPAADVEGHDSVAKVMILSALVFGRQLRLGQVARRGIDAITREEIDEAAATGTRLKHVATLEFSGPDGTGDVIARVAPELVPPGDSLARIEGTTNAVVCRANPVGEVTVAGPGAGPELAGQGVLSDLIAVARP
jgi:xylulokinase